MGEYTYPIIVFLLFLIAFSIILREYFCWYWKINARLKELKKITELLEDMYNNY
jgi:hypothetical protein